MALLPIDELRHPHDHTYNWRESIYFNFADRQHRLGGWIYMWTTPNKDRKAGMRVAFYQGVNDVPGSVDAAARSPDGMLRTPSGGWVYCRTEEFADLPAADFDDIELGGLHLRRRSEFEGYDITFDRGREASAVLRGRFTMEPWDYEDGVFQTPPWVATNRYHRSWVVSGAVRIGSREFELRTTGDSDHSWGRRDMDEFARHNFKMWSFQTPDGRRSVSAIEQGDGCYLGFVDVDGEVLGIRNIGRRAKYDRAGVQHEVKVEVTDTGGRVVRAQLDEMFAAIGHREPGGAWGFEGAGVYQVDGWGECSGVCSFFWPPGVAPQSMD